ncbi:transposase [Nitrosomonas ureae]|uniref:transposase n=1 Tax=Nitrosomonas ureae TaxID=44577 RepID=UPI003B8A9364
MLRPRENRKFVLLPRRWVVEHTFGWLNHSCRLSKSYERFNRNGRNLGLYRYNPYYVEAISLKLEFPNSFFDKAKVDKAIILASFLTCNYSLDNTDSLLKSNTPTIDLKCVFIKIGRKIGRSLYLKLEKCRFHSHTFCRKYIHIC